MQGRVTPLLFNLEFSDVSGPLSQFQAKKISKAGLAEIILSINQAAEKRDPEDRVREMIEALWPRFETLLEGIPDEAPSVKHLRPQHEILEELVAGVRGLDSRFQGLEGSVNERTPRSRRRRRLHPMVFEEAIHLSEEANDPVGLLLFAGIIKDDLPWLYELMVDVYREIKSGDPKAAQRAISRLRRVIKVTRRGPFMEFMMDDSKESHFLLMELPHMLEHMLHRLDVSPAEKPAIDNEENQEVPEG
jgi:hypothetical protein